MSDTKFNIEDYEKVKERKKKFYAKFLDGRIIVEAVEINDKTAVFKVTLYKSAEDQAKGLALSTGYAQEFKGQGGFANKFSWCENCEESAVGRALDNAGFSGNNKCSQEEMKKVANSTEDPNQKFPEQKQVSKPTLQKEVAHCFLCSSELMISKSGKGYYCPNFKDVSQGEHSRFQSYKLEEYLAQQRGA